MMVVYFCGLGLAGITCGLLDTPTALLAGLASIGLFASIYHPVGIAWLVRNAKSRGKALGINGIFGSIGVAAAGLTAGALIDGFGWRTAFIVPGLVSLATGLVLLACLRLGLVAEGAAARAEERAGHEIEPLLTPGRDEHVVGRAGHGEAREILDDGLAEPAEALLRRVAERLGPAGAEHVLDAAPEEIDREHLRRRLHARQVHRAPRHRGTARAAEALHRLGPRRLAHHRPPRQPPPRRRRGARRRRTRSTATWGSTRMRLKQSTLDLQTNRWMPDPWHRRTSYCISPQPYHCPLDL